MSVGLPPEIDGEEIQEFMLLVHIADVIRRAMEEEGFTELIFRNPVTNENRPYILYMI
jgi:hypothetical protein